MPARTAIAAILYSFSGFSRVGQVSLPAVALTRGGKLNASYEIRVASRHRAVRDLCVIDATAIAEVN
jgi:hypothetical protein